MTTEVAKATPVRAGRATAHQRITSLPHLWIVVSVACLAAFTALQLWVEWRTNWLLVEDIEQDIPDGSVPGELFGNVGEAGTVSYTATFPAFGVVDSRHDTP